MGKSELKNIIAEDNKVANIDMSKTTPGVKIDDSVLIKVKSNTYGKLIYINTKNGDETIWEKIGEVQTMTMGDLRAMKASQGTFFQNQWIIILGVDDASDCKAEPADIYRALAITSQYRNIIEFSDFNAVCRWNPQDIANKVSLMSKGAKQNLIVALNTFIANGVLDSFTKIKAFEKALKCDLSRPE